MLRSRFELFDFDVEHVGDARQPRGGIEDVEQFLLLLDAELQVGGDGVGELGRLIHAHGGDDGFVVERLLQLDVLLEEAGDALHQLLDCGRHFEVGFAGAHGGDEEAVRSLTSVDLARSTPSTSTLMLPSGIFTLCTMLQMVPTW